MYQDLFQRLGLSKNEARIYEILLREGALSVSDIAAKSNVHRRNVYDALGRLAERDLVFEMLESRENKYQAAPPEKFVTPGAIDVFADHVVITKSANGVIDDQTTFTIIVNKQTADIFRALFAFLGTRKTA